jgi:sugar O-acyltransferase (sialic acid O-acetyltransferase NeuD family)
MPPPETSLVPVMVPLVNPNEREANLASLEVHEGQLVAAGQVLATLEATKATGELAAPSAGYVTGLQRQAGDTVRAGEVLCYLADTANAKPLPHPALRATLSRGERGRGAALAEEPSEEGSVSSPPPVGEGGPEARVRESTRAGEIPGGLRITRPALLLAQQNGVDLGALPHGPLVTESVVREWLEGHKPIPAGQPGSGSVNPANRDEMPAGEEEMPGTILVYGGGGHGKMVIDLLRLLPAYRIAGVVDDGLQAGAQVLGVPVLGGSSCLEALLDRGVGLAVNAVGGIGNIQSRVAVFERLAQAGMACPAIVHPTAFVEVSAVLEAGAQVFHHAYVGSAARVGFGTIVNTGVVVAHDCQVGVCANLSPGALLAGGVQVGDYALVGMGVTVNLEVKIGARARIGNGATIKRDVPDGAVVRAGTIWPSSD